MNVLLLDGTGLAYRSYYAFVRNPLRNSKGEETSLTFAFVNTLLRLLERYKPERAAVVFDAPGRTFRHELDPQYKAGRPPMPESMVQQLPRLEETLDAFRLPRLQIGGVEADDVLGTLARRFEAQQAKVYLVTADKDFQQLVSPWIHLVRFRRSPGEMEELGPEELKQSLGFLPEQVVDYLALCGDAVDNIRGIAGVGEKTARKLIVEYGSLERLFASLQKIPGAALRRKLEAGQDDALRARKLLRIVTDVPLEIGEPALHWDSPDWNRVRTILRQLEFFQVLRQLPTVSDAAPALQVQRCHHDAALTALQAPLQASSRLSLWLQPAPSLGAPRPTLALAWAADRAAVVDIIPPPAQPSLGDLGLESVSPRGCSWQAIRTLLAPILGQPKTCKVGIDLKRLAQDLEPQGLELGPPWFDVLLAAYVLDPVRSRQDLEALSLELLDWDLDASPSSQGAPGGAGSSPDEAAQAAARRAVALWRLGECLPGKLHEEELQALFDDLEMPLLSVLLDMERAGVKVDGPRLQQLSEEFERRCEALEQRIVALAGRRFNVLSPRQLGQVLFDELRLPHGRRTRTGWSTDSDVLERLQEEHEIARLVLEYRQLSKLRSTYTDALPRLVRRRTGRIHTSFNQAVASTGRLSSSDPNLQNIPTRSEVGRRIREAFVPEPPRDRLLSADYSQIELRIMAHLSQDRALLQAFHSSDDVHTLTAARIAGCAPHEVRPEQRAAAKTVNFGVIYGMGARGLAQQLGISLDEAKRFIAEYFASYPGVRHYTQEMVQQARARGYVLTLLGRKLRLPALQSAHPGQRAFAERVAVNAPIQGSAADLVKTAMVRVHAALLGAGLQTRMILQVHDELLFEAPEPEVEALRVLVRREMEGAMTLSVPLRVDIGVGENWAEAH